MNEQRSREVNKDDKGSVVQKWSRLGVDDDTTPTTLHKDKLRDISLQLLSLEWHSPAHRLNVAADVAMALTILRWGRTTIQSLEITSSGSKYQMDGMTTLMISFFRWPAELWSLVVVEWWKWWLKRFIASLETHWDQYRPWKISKWRIFSCLNILVWVFSN